MGNSASKAAKSAGSAARHYPQRPSGPPPSSKQTPLVSNTDPASTSPSSRPGPTSHTRAQPSESRNEAIDLDARDPDFASRLSELGPVKPYPTYSPSSKTGSAAFNTTSSPSEPSTRSAPPGKSGIFPTPRANPAVAILAARQQFSEAAEQEKIMAGRKGFEGKQFLDVATIRKMLALRDEQRMKGEDIERALGLKKGTVAKLGRVGVVEAA